MHGNGWFGVLGVSNPSVFRRCTLSLRGNAEAAGSGGGVDTAFSVFVLARSVNVYVFVVYGGGKS